MKVDFPHMKESLARMLIATQSFDSFRNINESVPILCTRNDCGRCAEWKEKDHDIPRLLLDQYKIAATRENDWSCDSDDAQCLAISYGVSTIPAIILLPPWNDRASPPLVIDPFSLLKSSCISLQE